MAKTETPNENPRKFEVVYKDEDGIESVWKYDLDKFSRGPISVENKYPAGYIKEFERKRQIAKSEKKISTLEKARAEKIKNESRR